MTTDDASDRRSIEWELEYAGRSRGLAITGIVVLALGAGLRSATVLLLGIPIVGYVMYDRLTRFEQPRIEFERTVDSRHPLPGRDVSVTVQLTNVGESSVPDLRVADGVPEALAVIEGSPRAGFSLAPGESASFTYTIRARRGTHPFVGTTLIARNLSGSRRARSTVDDPTPIDCRVQGETVGLHERASSLTGNLETSNSGAGVEFHSTREYQPTDPINRIDWRRLAAGGGLTTVTYREPTSAFVQLLVDRREETLAAFTDRAMTHRENVSFASAVIANTLLADHHMLGVTTIGDDREDIEPSAGPDQEIRIRQRFDELGDEDERAIEEATQAELPVQPDGGSTPDTALSASELKGRADELVDRTPQFTQFIVVSALYDDAFVPLIERLQAHGRDTIVIAPRQRTTSTAGQRIIEADRRLRIGELRRRDVIVVNWDTAEPLRYALDRNFGVGT